MRIEAISAAAAAKGENDLRACLVGQIADAAVQQLVSEICLNNPVQSILTSSHKKSAIL